MFYYHSRVFSGAFGSHENLLINLCGKSAGVELFVTTQVELGWGNGNVEDIFFVAGYHLEGSVESQVFECSYTST